MTEPNPPGKTTASKIKFNKDGTYSLLVSNSKNSLNLGGTYEVEHQHLVLDGQYYTINSSNEIEAINDYLFCSIDDKGNLILGSDSFGFSPIRCMNCIDKELEQQIG